VVLDHLVFHEAPASIRNINRNASAAHDVLSESHCNAAGCSWQDSSNPAAAVHARQLLLLCSCLKSTRPCTSATLLAGRP
jgi:hypothetical protein